MHTFLKTKRLAGWKLLERWEIRNKFPMMPSGEIRKYLLRQDSINLLGRKP
jgi:hypothetical protein